MSRLILKEIITSVISLKEVSSSSSSAYFFYASLIFELIKDCNTVNTFFAINLYNILIYLEFWIGQVILDDPFELTLL